MGAGDTRSFDYIFNTGNTSVSGGYGHHEDPMTLQQTDKTVTNKLWLGVIDGLYSTYWSSPYGPVEMTPLFAPVVNVTARLEYVEERNSSLGFGLKSENLYSNYKLILSGITPNCFDEHGLYDITNIQLDCVYNAGQGQEVKKRSLYHVIYYNNGKYYLRYPTLSDGPQLGEELSCVNGELTIPFTHEKVTLQNNTINNVRFIRGLADTWDNVVVYRPDRIAPHVAQGESLKYSCFMVRESNNQRKYARVFTASDVFTANTVYGAGTADGVIMDLCGSDDVSGTDRWMNDAYGFSYYGGEISPFTTTYNGSEPEYFVTDSAGNNFESTSKQVTRVSAKNLAGTNIADFLGIRGEDGNFTYAGIFLFKAYNGFKILGDNEEIQNAYVYSAEPYDSVNTGARRPAPWLINQQENTYAWKTVYEATTAQYDPLVTGRVSFDPSNQIHEVPDGYIFMKVGDVEMLAYIEESSSIVSKKGNLTDDVDAKDHKVRIEYLFP
jgi:hypothetical protein